MKKWLAVVAVVAIGLGCYHFMQKPKNEYLTTVVRKGDLVRSVEASGEVFAENLVDVGAQVSGQIKRLYVKVGDEIKKGDKIAQIDSIKQQNALDQQLAALEILNARLKSAQISFSVAQSQYAREQNLSKHNATTTESLENFKNSLSAQDANLKVIEAQIKQTKIEISTAKTNLAYTDIRAPLSGTVVSVPVEVGQTINANQTTPTIVNIADLNKMEIKMQISEGDISSIKVGDRVEYNILSDIDKKYSGYLTSIDPGLTSLSDGKYKGKTSGISSNEAIYYYAKLKVDNSSRFLRIGMTTQNQIIVQEIKNSLILPTMAIKSDENGNFVLVKSGQNIEKRAIKVGISSSLDTQILSGVKESEQIIVSQISQNEIRDIVDKRKPKMKI